ncbi:MAG: GTPase ObgE, partial [Rhodospirillaceae bacterium]
GHIERCAVLLHLVDGTEEDVAAAYKTVRRELKAYGGGLGGKKELVALNKIDALDDATRAEKAAALAKASRKKVHLLSSISGEGRDAMLRSVAKIVATARAEGKAPADDFDDADAEETEETPGGWTP